MSISTVHCVSSLLHNRKDKLVGLGEPMEQEQRGARAGSPAKDLEVSPKQLGVDRHSLLAEAFKAGHAVHCGAWK